MFLSSSLSTLAVVLATLGIAPQSGLITSSPASGVMFDTGDCSILAPLVCEGQPATFSSKFAGTNYAWTLSNNTAGAFFCGATNQQSVCVDTTQAGTFNIRLDYVLQSGPKWCTFDVTVEPALSIADVVGDTVCEGEGAVLSTTILAGNGPYTYSWTVDTGSGPVLIAGANTDTLVLNALTLADTGTYCVTVDAQCGPAQSCAALTVEDCTTGEAHCTLTQGAYGSAGGTFNGLSTIDLLNQLLATDLVVGKPGRSLTIQAGNGACVITRLPANSTPATLPAIGDATLNSTTCQTSPTALPLKNGKFKNILLGQTITLALNTRLDAGLSDVGVCESMTTQSGDDELTVSISANVIDALANLGLPITVGGVLELANRALAGQATGGASLSEVNGAVDAINRGFDECRTLTSCSNS